MVAISFMWIRGPVPSRAAQTDARQDTIEPFLAIRAVGQRIGLILGTPGRNRRGGTRWTAPRADLFFGSKYHSRLMATSSLAVGDVDSSAALAGEPLVHGDNP
jgi:hypothetical protein